MTRRQALLGLFALSCKRDDEWRSSGRSSPTSARLALVFRDVGLAAPDGVLYDDTLDVYFVSNRGSPATDAGDGFVSRLRPDGTVDAATWLGRPGTTLDDPSGLAIAGDTLFVADGSVVKSFDRHTGVEGLRIELPAEVRLEGATIGPDGDLILCDVGRGALYAVSPYGKLTTFAPSLELGRPSDAASNDERTWVVSRSGRVGVIDRLGVAVANVKSPVELEGIVRTDGLLFVSGGGKVLRGAEPPRGREAALELEPVITDLGQVGKLGFDRKRDRLLVPVTDRDELRVYDVR